VVESAGGTELTGYLASAKTMAGQSNGK